MQFTLVDFTHAVLRCQVLRSITRKQERNMADNLQESGKLEFPYVSLIPYKIMSAKCLCPNAKLHYGCLAALSKKEGYCWASDEQLAEMHGVKVRVIQKWHEKLENLGFIYRETKSISYRNEAGKLLWTKKRKIWTDLAFSQKNCEHAQKDTFNEHAQKDAISKKKPFNAKKVNEGATRSMPFSKKEKINIDHKQSRSEKSKDFYKILSEDQKKIHDEILIEARERSQTVESSAITFWLRKWGIERVKNVLKLYRDEARKAELRKRKIASIGGFMRGALNKGLKAQTESDVSNKEFAHELSQTYPFIEVLQKYVRICQGIEFYYTLPEKEFHKIVEEACWMASELSEI